jgi:acyl carrier protein
MEHPVTKLTEIILANFDTGGRPLEPDTSFESLEFDSLVLVELAVMLTREYAFDVTDEQLADCGTIGAAADLVVAALAARSATA